MVRKITVTKGRLNLTDEIEAIAEGEVKRIGNGGMVMSSKKHIGKKVYVLIRKRP